MEICPLFYMGGTFILVTLQCVSLGPGNSRVCFILILIAKIS